MSDEEHRSRHEMLHKMLDELVADFIVHTGSYPSKTPILELMQWSAAQAKSPTPDKE